MNKKILISLTVIGVVAAIVIGGTIAYFSDTETSTGNTFTAGELDLIVDIDGVVYNPLNRAIFGPLTDIKPGDGGEETISLHVDNDACGFVKFDLTSDLDNSCTEPEAVEEGTGCPIGGTEGELNDLMVWKIWNDEGNILGWQCSDGAGNPAPKPCTADPAEGDNILNGEFERTLISGPLTGDKEYAFGEMPASNVLYYGFAWELPGAVTNIAQSDSFTADMILKAEQKRNQFPNGCPTGDITPEPIRIDRTQPGFGDGGWAGWSCPADTTAIGGGIVSSDNPVGGNGVAAPSAPAVDGFNYPVYPHYTYNSGVGETGYVVHDLPDGLGNNISFYVLCLPN